MEDITHHDSNCIFSNSNHRENPYELLAGLAGIDLFITSFHPETRDFGVFAYLF